MKVKAFVLRWNKYVNKKCKKKTILGLNFKKILCILRSAYESTKPQSIIHLNCQ